MNPETLFCPNRDCPARGQIGRKNIHPHSQKEKRCRCSVCNQTFSTTKGTLFYRLKTDPEIVAKVIVLLGYGCPANAIVEAFGLDARTVENWWKRAGAHCQEVHKQEVEQAKLDLEQVQADEIKVKAWGRAFRTAAHEGKQGRPRLSVLLPRIPCSVFLSPK